MKQTSKTHRSALLLCLFPWILTGCASSHKFDTLISKGEYKKAAEAAAQDLEDIRILATSLIVQAVQNGQEISANIDILNTSCGLLGRRALKQLCRRATRPASSHACIALAGKRLPRGPALKEYLESEFSDVRVRAARKWASELADDRLLDLLGDLDPGVRAAAIEVLGRREVGRRAQTALVSAALKNALIKDPSATVRSQVAKTGPALGEGAILDLKAALQDDNMGVRLAALQGLAMLPGPAATDILKARANGPIDEMALVAIVELRRKGETGMDSRLEDAVKSPQQIIRRSTLLRLERAKTPRRLEFIEKALKDESPPVVLLAARLLGATEKGRAPAEAALRKLIEEKTTEAPSAQNLLATWGDNESIEEIKHRLQEAEQGPEDRKALILNILDEAYRCPELASAFAALMGHDDATVRLRAARASLLSSQ